MFKKNYIVATMAVALFAAWGGSSRATLLSMPKALTSPLSALETSQPSWGSLTYDWTCLQDLDRCQGRVKKVALFGFPKALKPQLDRIPLSAPALGPMAHTMFCIQYERDCKVRRIGFRQRKYELTPDRWRDLVEVNTKVNRDIKPERNLAGVAGEKWLIAPNSGDCNDYAVTKRHELLERGWPSRTLLLSEVVVHTGEHHLVLVVRTAEGDLVLDSLNQNIRPWDKIPYQWVRMQSPKNPRWWASIRPARTASL